MEGRLILDTEASKLGGDGCSEIPSIFYFQRILSRSILEKRFNIVSLSSKMDDTLT